MSKLAHQIVDSLLAKKVAECGPKPAFLRKGSKAAEGSREAEGSKASEAAEGSQAEEGSKAAE